MSMQFAASVHSDQSSTRQSECALLCVACSWPIGEMTPRRACRPGERISYVIVRREAPGEKTLKLITCVASLEEFLKNRDLKLYYNYYVSRPLFGALGRILRMVPISLRWHLVHSSGCFG